MTGLWSPEFWSGLTGPGIAVLAAAGLIWALVTGRIVIGRTYREALAAKDDTIAELRKSGETKDDTINTLTKGLLEATIRDDTATRMLTAFREAVKDGT